ncbi:glycosyltransferase family 2 protein [Flavobacterium sp. DG1-102-2]|uniref:glycosyltransferase family 2 protein n=1 Tax=Flavobacterium sp. DG1-102-2 TaxID=3081663 RepID=UPI00294A6897|nr:glycosyltransferase family 2 protein [Flavobacterium sp. DG1-102-2]MDV6168068.1 glycosyltransferase family 2 protein [Flavobacterium sp. DG1-102-2]
MKICLIITTYNWPEALELSLKSVMRQSRPPDEVIIADDGSKGETKHLIESYMDKIKNLRHVWHEDNGYQRAKVVNLAIMSSEADFIITTDQDCILHKDYVLDYSLQAEHGCYISAYRINLRKELTYKILAQKRLPNMFELLTQTKWNLKHQQRIPSKWKKKTRYITTSSNGTYGCNMAFYRNDLMEINGYNENFVGWGPEDSEMTQRLINNGKKWKRIYYSAILYHLYHPELSKSNLEFNVDLLRKTIDNRLTYICNGICKSKTDVDVA